MEFEILDFIQSFRCVFLDNVFAFITHLGDGGFIWILTAIIMLFSKKYRKCGVMMLISLAICAIFTSVIMKPLVGRVRPFIQAGIKPYIAPPGGYSFPSGHTSSSFTASFSMLFCHKKEGVRAVVLASLIAFSRMYFYVHFPTDVLAGVVVGIASACLIKYAYIHLNKNKN